MSDLVPPPSQPQPGPSAPAQPPGLAPVVAGGGSVVGGALHAADASGDVAAADGVAPEAHRGPSLEAMPAEPAEPTRPAGPGVLEWFWRGKALREARARLVDLPSRQRVVLRRARAVAALGDRALDPIDAGRHGVTYQPALSLYREAAYWALLAQRPDGKGNGLAAAWSATPSEVLLGAAGGVEPLRAAQAALLEGSFAQVAEASPEAQEASARAAAAFVHALVDRPDAAEREEGRLLLQRWARVLGTLAMVVGVTVGAIVGVRFATRGPDLAAGKPWRTSSTGMTCAPAQHRCGAATTDILFHTNDEESPWFEVDLQSEQVFSVVEVTNRSDCCPDRALPLAIEVSSDRTGWQEVARRTEPFSVWRAKLPKYTARYVRLRAMRRTVLHLEGVAVRP